MCDPVDTKLPPREELEALGRQALYIAHDFNNCLASVLGCLDLLKSQVTSEQGQQLIREGLRTVQRGKYLAG